MKTETAKIVLDILISELKKNDLTDIGTFVLELDHYLLENSNIRSNLDILNYLCEIGSDNSKRALSIVLTGSINYFKKARSIPEQYDSLLNRFVTESHDKPTHIGDVNLFDRLRSSDLASVINLFEEIKECINSDDDVSFNSLLNTTK